MDTAKRFHQNLTAARHAGAPLEFESRIPFFLRPIKLAVLEQLHGRFSDDHRVDKPLDEVEPDSSRYLAACEVFAKTESMPLVLDGLVTRFRVVRAIDRIQQWSCLYVLLILSCGIVGLTMFSYWVAPELEAISNDLSISKPQIESKRFSILPMIRTFSFVAVGLLVAALIMIVGGAGRKLGMMLGGKEFLRSCLATCGCRVTASLVETGMNADDAANLSNRLVGGSDTTLADIQSARGDVSLLHQVGNYFQGLSSHQFDQLKSRIPIALISTIGGLISILYCISIYWPIVSMFRDVIDFGLN